MTLYAKYYRPRFVEARRKCIEAMGSKCLECGFSDVRALQIDHVNGGGLKDLRSSSGSTYYRRVLNSFTNSEGKYQLLCANCNWIKRNDHYLV